jgi:hypothetical protein
MSENECRIFGELIKNNHTVWGIHMIGNAGYTDEKGFIKVKPHDLLSHIKEEKRIIAKEQLCLLNAETKKNLEQQFA